jgi:hypothetical protein
VSDEQSLLLGVDQDQISVRRLAHPDHEFPRQARSIGGEREVYGSGLHVLTEALAARKLLAGVSAAWRHAHLGPLFGLGAGLFRRNASTAAILGSARLIAWAAPEINSPPDAMTAPSRFKWMVMADRKTSTPPICC